MVCRTFLGKDHPRLVVAGDHHQRKLFRVRLVEVCSIADFPCLLSRLDSRQSSFTNSSSWRCAGRWAIYLSQDFVVAVCLVVRAGDGKPRWPGAHLFAFAHRVKHGTAHGNTRERRACGEDAHVSPTFLRACACSFVVVRPVRRRVERRTWLQRRPRCSRSREALRRGPAERSMSPGRSSVASSRASPFSASAVASQVRGVFHRCVELGEVRHLDELIGRRYVARFHGIFLFLLFGVRHRVQNRFFNDIW